MKPVVDDIDKAEINGAYPQKKTICMEQLAVNPDVKSLLVTVLLQKKNDDNFIVFHPVGDFVLSKHGPKLKNDEYHRTNISIFEKTQSAIDHLVKRKKLFQLDGHG